MTLDITRTDLRNPLHARTFIDLLQHYASGPSGGGKPLSDAVCARLLASLPDWSGFVSFLAHRGDTPVGLINCFTGFSTFRAQALLNVHDVVVHTDFRHQGVARALFSAVEETARATGCCKITLEVLAGNTVARNAYEGFGFAPYVLDPAMGNAIFMEKLL